MLLAALKSAGQLSLLYCRMKTFDVKSFYANVNNDNAKKRLMKPANEPPSYICKPESHVVQKVSCDILIRSPKGLCMKSAHNFIETELELPVQIKLAGSCF